jgi:hypothetical protein
MLARTFLRLCALEAVRPSSLLGVASPAWPTDAKDFVFDSRLDPLERLEPEQYQKAIVVYTDNENLDQIAQAGPVLYNSIVDLVFELSVVAKLRNGEEYVVGLAETDSELEAELDAVEQQIYFALHYGATGALFRKMSRLPFKDWQSHRMASSEEGPRLAMRSIRTKVRLAALAYDPTPAAPLVGLARLPEPLTAIVAQLGESTYLYKLAAAIAAATPTMPVTTPLKTIAITATPADPQGVASGDPAGAIGGPLDNLDQ